MSPAKKPRRTAPRYEDLLIRITGHDVSASGSINHVFVSPNLVHLHSEDEPALEFKLHLYVNGKILEPTDRAGHDFQLSLVGDESPSNWANRPVKDYKERDDYGSTVYRTYRGAHIPVFNPPLHLGLIDKVRGETAWTSYIFTSRQFVAQTLQLLQACPELFLVIREMRQNRTRGLQHFSIQSSDEI